MKVSASKPHNFRSDKFRATRPLDYIYDPLFTFSGPKQYYRTAHESYQTASEFSVQPIFDSMFSDMGHYPRANLVVRPSHQVPQSIDTSYKGKIKATSQERTVTAEVTGTDRYKYFRRPVTETQTSSSNATRLPLLGLENVTNLGIMAPPTTAQKLGERSGRVTATTQVRGVQTDYRESETQTLPWAPQNIVHGNTRPEVLDLEQLTWGNGLPPGQHEVEIVEHLRRKQAWAAQLPPLDTESNIKRRFKLIAEMEKSDWKFREKEIQVIHDERMKKSEQLLEQHKLMNRARLSYRMKYLQDDMNKRKEVKLQILHHNKERALRKLLMKEKGYNPKHHKKNVIDEHIQRTSELYAPMKRFGTSFKNRHEILAEKNIKIDNTDISALEDAVEFHPTFDYHKASQPKKKQIELCVRETRWTMKNLTELHQDLQELRLKEQRKEDTFLTQAIEVIAKPKKEVDIPCVPLTNEAQERICEAAILIQRVIHGRAVQIQMYERRDRWKEVMEELKTSEPTAEKLAALKVFKDQRNFDDIMFGVMENTIGQNIGTSIGQTLDLLATELLRFKNEEIAHSQALQAESARWKREIQESGRRQQETRRREEHNLMFSQLLQVYQDSVNEFLQDLVTRAREQEAKAGALEYAQEMALLAELEEAAREEELRKPVSADLLFEFIAPEGLQELARTCMLILKQKYVEARHNLVQTGRAEPLMDDISLPDSEVQYLASSVMGPSTSSSSYNYSEVNMAGSSSYGESHPDATDDNTESEVMIPVPARFGLTTPASQEERLLSRIMRDMCYVAGSLLHTAAKILNKALQISNIPRESFADALRRTMAVINEAREEIARLILPKRQRQPEVKLLPSQLASEEIIAEATKIVDEILTTVRERIAKKQLQKMSATDLHSTVPDIVIESDVHSEAQKLVEEIVAEAERKVFQAIVDDFLTDLIDEAVNRVDRTTSDSQSNLQ